MQLHAHCGSLGTTNLNPERNGTRTGLVRGGHCGRWRRSWLIPGIRGGRCGTGSGPTSTWSTRATPGWGIGRCSAGTCPRAGSSPAIVRTRRWSARPTSPPPRTPLRRAARLDRPYGGTCWPGCSLAAGAGGGWNRPGPTASPPTGAATATPAPRAPTRVGRRTPTSVRTRSCRTWRLWPSSLPAAVAILLTSGGQAQGSDTAQISDPAETACLIDQLRTAGVSLTYDPDTRTIHTDGNSAVAVTVCRYS